MPWDGIERRSEQHDGMLPECFQIFKSLEAKIDDLVTRADKVNGRYEKHLETSVTYRSMVDKNTSAIEGIVSLKRWWWGAILTIALFILGGVFSFIFLWGVINKQVLINTERLLELEAIHPRSGQQGIQGIQGVQGVQGVQGRQGTAGKDSSK